MELGNLLFGNSRGQFPIPRNKGWEGQLLLLFEAYAPAIESNYYGPAYENDTFTVRPYYWGDCECDDWGEEILRESPEATAHMNVCEYIKPNFLYKPTGFEIRFYKYPLRDSYMNQDINLRQFSEIIIDCIGSIKEGL